MQTITTASPAALAGNVKQAEDHGGRGESGPKRDDPAMPIRDAADGRSDQRLESSGHQPGSSDRDRAGAEAVHPQRAENVEDPRANRRQQHQPQCDGRIGRLRIAATTARTP